VSEKDGLIAGPNCLEPGACKARTPGKNCRPCHARKNQAAAVEAARAPEVKMRRIDSYLKTRMHFVPEGMGDLNRTLRNSHVGLDERKQMFADMQEAERRRVAASGRREEFNKEGRRQRIIRSHEAEMDELSAMVRRAGAR
jgi:uncharacterized Ntn-hydrolase superfamily protein